MAAFCQKCGAKFSDKRARCPRCLEPVAEGTASPAQAPGTGNNTVWLVGSGLALLLLVAAIVSIRSYMYTTSPVGGEGLTARIAPNTTVRARVAPSQPSVTSRLDRSFMDSDRAGNAAYAMGEFERALAEYQKAIEKNPNDPMALNNLAQVLVRGGRTAEAIPYLDRAIGLNPSLWAPRFNRARAYGQLGDWAGAIADYRAAATLMPDDYVTVYNLGLALHKTGSEEAAITEFRRAAELAPSEPSFHLSLGISYERLKKPIEAAQSYEDYLTLAPEAANAAQVKARIQALKTPA